MSYKLCTIATLFCVTILPCSEHQFSVSVFNVHICWMGRDDFVVVVEFTHLVQQTATKITQIVVR